MSFPMSVSGVDVVDITFETPENAASWLAKEGKYWAWINKQNAAEIGVASHEQRANFWQKIAQAESEIQRFISNQTKEQAERSRNAINAYLLTGLVSDTPRAKAIVALREYENGEIVAQAALATYLGEVTPKSNSGIPLANRYAVLRGQLAMVLFDAGVDRHMKDNVKKSLDGLVNQNKQLSASLLSKNEDQLAKLKGATAEVLENHVKSETQRTLEFDAVLAKLNEGIERANIECETTKSAYTAHMEIQAPVEYWTQKKDEHKKAARLWGGILILYAGVGSYGLYHLVERTLERLKDLTDPGMHIAVTASLAVAVTVIFWIARFLSRLYLSERHMAIDARARIAMAKVYLALTASKHLDEKDRSLVLQPLFRAGADGIIQEDNGLDGAIAMLARALESPRK